MPFVPFREIRTTPPDAISRRRRLRRLSNATRAGGSSRRLEMAARLGETAWGSFLDRVLSSPRPLSTDPEGILHVRWRATDRAVGRGGVPASDRPWRRRPARLY